MVRSGSIFLVIILLGTSNPATRNPNFGRGKNCGADCRCNIDGGAVGTGDEAGDECMNVNTIASAARTAAAIAIIFWLSELNLDARGWLLHCFLDNCRHPRA